MCGNSLATDMLICYGLGTNLLQGDMVVDTTNQRSCLQGCLVVGALLATLAILILGVVVTVRLLSDERRDELSRLPGALITWIMGRMPDE